MTDMPAAKTYVYYHDLFVGDLMVEETNQFIGDMIANGRRNQVVFDEWMQLDLEYIDNWSLWLDVKILLKTVPTVLLHKGAS